MAKASSANRMLSILDLFSEEHPAWTVDMLVEVLGTTRATTYRHVKALYAAGLIVPAAGGSYVLGPRFIEFDRQIRRTDPLLKAGVPVIRDEDDPVVGAIVICSFYGDKVLSVHVEKKTPDIAVTMERGLTVPLLFGSPSQVILAHMSPYQLKNVYAANADQIRSLNLGETWDEFREKMRLIRKAGYCVGGQVDIATMGVAAPVFHSKGAVSASLCYVQEKDLITPPQIEHMSELVVRAANIISDKLCNESPSNDTGNYAFPTPRIASQ